MTEKYKILARFIKDVSAETPNIETYIFVKDYISKYNFNIDINSIAVKDKVIEVNTKLSLSDPNKNEKKSYFEIIFATVIKIDDDLKEKKEIEKIILCDLQNKIYSDIEKTFFQLVVNSGYPETKPNKKIDFNELYNSRQS
jgi:Preprotein translocase subunit SecB